MTIGDVVELKSGIGPHLVIGELVNGTHAECVWFDPCACLHWSSIPLLCLKPVPVPVVGIAIQPQTPVTRP